MIGGATKRRLKTLIDKLASDFDGERRHQLALKADEAQLFAVFFRMAAGRLHAREQILDNGRQAVGMLRKLRPTEAKKLDVLRLVERRRRACLRLLLMRVAEASTAGGMLTR